MNKEFVNIILISSTWSLSHRKRLYLKLNSVLSEWSEVIFIESPYSAVFHTLLKFKSRIKILFTKRFFVNDENVKIFIPVIIFHHKIWQKFKSTSIIDNYLFRVQLSGLFKKYKYKKIILWLHDPYNYYLAEKLNPDHMIYDYYDNHEYNEDGNPDNERIYLNDKIIKNADLIFCTGKVMFDKSIIRNKNSYYLPNGHDFNINDINNTKKINLNLPGNFIIGYFGNIRNWIDFGLISDLIKSLKSAQRLLFIGPVENNVAKIFNNLKNNNKFLHIDKVHYETAGSYLKALDVGIIPFKLNKFTEGVLPNKLFEYLAFRIQIVSTSLPDMKYYSQYVNIAQNNSEFIEYCINNHKYKKQIDESEYRKIITENTWESRAEYINQQLKKTVGI